MAIIFCNMYTVAYNNKKCIHSGLKCMTPAKCPDLNIPKYYVELKFPVLLLMFTFLLFL
jgi:hypothetical protein